MPCPSTYHIHMKQGQIDAVVVGLRRIADELGGKEEGDES